MDGPAGNRPHGKAPSQTEKRKLPHKSRNDEKRRRMSPERGDNGYKRRHSTSSSENGPVRRRKTSIEPQQTYKQFLLSQPDNVSPEEAAKRFEQYQKEYRGRLVTEFYRAFRDTQWFKERYDPCCILDSHESVASSARAAAARFSTALEAGALAELEWPNVSMSSPGDDADHKSDTGATHPSDDGDHEVDGEDTERHNDGEDKEGKNNSLLSAHGAVGSAVDGLKDKQDGAVTQEYKHRAGFAFKRPFRLTPALSSKRGRDPPSYHRPCTLWVRSIPMDHSIDDLRSLFEREDGFIQLSLSEPDPSRNMDRDGWATFRDEGSCCTALAKLDKHKQHRYSLYLLATTHSRRPRRINHAPPIASTAERVLKDVQQMVSLTKRFDEEKGVDHGFDLGVPSGGEEVAKLRDVLHRYLRYVHSFCYYCGKLYSGVDDLLRCCGAHVVDDSGGTAEPSGETWAASLDGRIVSYLADTFNVEERTGKLLRSRRLLKFHKEHTSLVEEGKYRCSLCSKLFSGPEFVAKHLRRHTAEAEEVEKLVRKDQAYRNYCSDPCPIKLEAPSQREVKPGRGRRGNRRRGGNRGKAGGRQKVEGRNGPRKGGLPVRRRSEPPPGVFPDPRALRVYTELESVPAGDSSAL